MKSGVKTVEKIDSFFGLPGGSADKPLQIKGEPGWPASCKVLPIPH